jgi:hypothetical protein
VSCQELNIFSRDSPQDLILLKHNFIFEKEVYPLKKLMTIPIICLLLLFACVTANQDLKSLSSSYDGIWEGYTDTAEGRFEIKMEIENGRMTGFFEDKKINGYIESDDNFIINPFSIMGAQVRLDANFMSSDRIEGIVIAPESRPIWFVVKSAADN